MARLPNPGGDTGNWGDILNDYLSQEHNSNGSLKTSGTLSSYATKDYVDDTVTTGAPDASNSTKGLVRLTGDLGGTASSPSVPGLANKQDLDSDLTAIAALTTTSFGRSLLTQTDAPTTRTTLSAAGVDDVISGADYVVTLVGSTVTATPRVGSGLTKYSGTNASTVIQSAIDALTPPGSATDGGGGKIYITRGQYTLTNELTITGWVTTYVNPLSQLVIQGDGLATQLRQSTSGQNGIVIKNGARFALMDIRIFTNINAKSSLLLDNTGADTEWSCNRSVINNVHLDSNSTTQPAAIFRNFFDLSVPMLEVQSNSRSALVLENVSTTTNYGNSHFGFLRCTCASPASPNAGLTITSSSSTKFMNLLTFDNYECMSAYYGIYTAGAKYCKWGFVDIEGLTKAIYFDGTSGGFGFESRNNEIAGGYLLSNGSNTTITQTLYTGGNKVSAFIQNSSTGVPIADASNYRPSNRYDIYTDRTAAGLITLANPATELTLTYTDGTVFNKRRFTTKTASYTLSYADASTTIEMNSASATTVTVPLNATTTMPIGTVIEIVRLGAGTVTFVADSGVAIRSGGGLLAISSQYASVYLRKRATDEWVLTGSLA